MNTKLMLPLLAIVVFASFSAPTKKFKPPKEFVHVPAGEVFADSTVSAIDDFYISKFEVSNAAYHAFLQDLKASGDVEQLALAQIDSAKWSEALLYSQPFTDYYHSHPAYVDYPAVNMTHEGARLYCEWLTKKYNRENPDGPKLIFRLPTKQEWIRAARPENIYAVYPWKGRYLRRNTGEFLANFKWVGVENIHQDLETGEYEVMPWPNIRAEVSETSESSEASEIDRNAVILAPVKSFLPTDIGTYHQSGNAAEMIADPSIVMGGSWRNTGYDIRIESEMKNTAPAPHIGFRVVMEVVE